MSRQTNIELIRFIAVLLFVSSVSMQISAQCGNGIVVFRESFGGSFSSADFGPPLSLGKTSYGYNASGSIQEGEYGLRKHTGGMNNWVEGNDNTGQGGYMLMIRSKNAISSFYEATVSGFCRAQSQVLCFSAASLSRKGIGKDVTIHVQVHNPGNQQLLAEFTSQALKNNDSISWSSFSFGYPLPNGVSSVQLNFFFTSSSSAPDDFAIDDIRVTNIGSSFVNGASSNEYPFINGRYEYPVFACLNESVSFTMPGVSLIGKEVQWERMMPDYSYQAIPGANQPVFIIDSAKRADSRFYRLRIADSGYLQSANCSYPTSPVGLHVDPEPVIESNAPICEGKDLSISVAEGSYVSWTGPNGFTATGKKIAIPGAGALNSGVYTANVTYNAGCVLNFSVKDTIQVLANPIRINIPADTVICQGQSIAFDVTNASGSLYNWSTGSASPKITIHTAGLYTIIIYQGSCMKSASSKIRVIEKPLVQLRADTTFCIGDTLLLKALTANADRFLWSTQDKAPEILVTQKGRYSVQVSNQCGIASAFVNIGFIRCSEELIIPTAFTPNRDGLNDVFRPLQDASIKQYELKIYNRWGQVIFTTRDIAKGWDGTLNRIPQPSGGYIWLMEYISKSGRKHTETGTLSLIR
ncbi:MAG: hypothetical protein RLZZ28_418 [Bacteroidota bacterium]|jgi:gliding motility-associated-like protein